MISRNYMPLSSPGSEGHRRRRHRWLTRSLEGRRGAGAPSGGVRVRLGGKLPEEPPTKLFAAHLSLEDRFGSRSLVLVCSAVWVLLSLLTSPSSASLLLVPH